MMIAKKGSKRVRVAFFYCCRRRRLNSVRQVNGDLPHPVVCAASAPFSTLSTHGKVWDVLLSLTLPSAAVPWSIAPYGEPGEICTRAPSESGNSRLTCRREVKSEALSLVERDIVYDDDHGFDFRRNGPDECTVCCRPFNRSVRTCGIFDNSEEAKKWSFCPIRKGVVRHTK